MTAFYKLCTEVAIRNTRGIHASANDTHSDIVYEMRERALSEFLTSMDRYLKKDFRVELFRMIHENSLPYVYLLKTDRDGSSTEVRLEVLRVSG